MTIQTAFRRAGRIRGLETSEILRLTEPAAALKAEGRDVVALSTGAPDFPAPKPVITAAHATALAGKTRYPATAGTPGLRDAVATMAGVTRAATATSRLG